jgi:hypothetical protein
MTHLPKTYTPAYSGLAVIIRTKASKSSGTFTSNVTAYSIDTGGNQRRSGGGKADFDRGEAGAERRPVAALWLGGPYAFSLS